MSKGPVDGRLEWNILWWFAFLVRPFLCKLEISGLEHVPRTDGFVLVSNHISAMDIVVNGFASPRQIHYIAKAELFRVNPLITFILRLFGIIPIERGGRDVDALNEAVEFVRSGRVIGIFPEGTRSRNGHLQAGKTGAARIAMVADVPVVPVVCLNSARLFRDIVRWARPTIAVKFGPPIRLDGDPGKSSDARRETRKIMLALAALLPEERRGIYCEEMEEPASVNASG